MVAGPFDRRRGRLRCEYCSAHHLKCSRQQPCSRCKASGRDCVYLANQPSSDTSQVATKFIWINRVGQRRKQLTQSPAIVKSPNQEYTVFLSLFDDFAEFNNLTGTKGRTFSKDIRMLKGIHDSPYLLDAMMAVGAVHALKKLPPQDARKARYLYSGTIYYARAVTNLRNTLEGIPEVNAEYARTSILWATFFLGFFELLNENTAQPWLQHMIHGTCRGLEAAGPSICTTEAGRLFFTHIKVFEVCRVMLYNETTVLSNPAWLDMQRKLRMDGNNQYQWTPLDSLLDVIVDCTSLCYRIIRIKRFEMCETAPPGTPRAAHDGKHLRQALQAWDSMYGKPIHEFIPKVENETALLAQIFYETISIYLWGLFFFKESEWHRLGVETCNISLNQAERHARNIIELVQIALEKTKLSYLLLLFPLKVAGSVVTTIEERSMVLGYVENIRHRFSVALEVQLSLQGWWTAPKLIEPPDMDIEEIIVQG